MILAHRGLWQEQAERNSLRALQNALAEGFGVETDIRDCNGELVISHDPPRTNSLRFSDFLDAYIDYPRAGVLALNIKSDGLQDALANALNRLRIEPSQYFVFDMAVPDAVGYLRRGMPCFTRQSELELVPAFIDQAAGVWLDCFHTDWINGPDILAHCTFGRQVTLVSPELHGRDRQKTWRIWREAYRDIKQRGYASRIMLCTDHPREARDYFDEAD
jgi:hypothetical protein